MRVVSCFQGLWPCPSVLAHLGGPDSCWSTRFFGWGAGRSARGERRRPGWPVTGRGSCRRSSRRLEAPARRPLRDRVGPPADGHAQTGEAGKALGVRKGPFSGPKSHCDVASSSNMQALSAPCSPHAYSLLLGFLHTPQYRSCSLERLGASSGSAWLEAVSQRSLDSEHRIWGLISGI